MATVTGYAAVFGVEVTISGLFRETIASGAFSETLVREDVRAAFNHNLDHLLGRQSAGTLTLCEDKTGLRYVITLNEQDPLAMSVAAKISRRDVTGSSFWFVVDRPEDEEWTPGRRGELPLRTLRRLRLVEVGPVALPAYEATTARVLRAGTIGARDRLRLQIQIAKARAWQPSPLVGIEKQCAASSLRLADFRLHLRDDLEQFRTQFGVS